MQFLELSLQGVRGFSPTVRAALRSGYCLLKAAGANQPPLSGLCSSLLYPDGRGGDAEYKATSPSSVWCEASVALALCSS